MKQIVKIISIAAIFAIAPGCKQDAPIGCAVVRVNTAALYDKLGITDLVAGTLAGGGTTVTDSVLVYDRQGALVARLGTASASLQDVTIGLDDLPQGTYTVVAWQTTSNGSEPFWPMIDADQLATARIIQLYPSTISCLRAIGMYTATVTIGPATASVNAEMEPMGSVVDIGIDGLKPECDYKYLSLVAGVEEPAVDGFYVNPARSGEEQWVFSADRKDRDRPIAGVMPSSAGSKVFTLSHGEDKSFELYGTNKTTNKPDSLVHAVFTLEPGLYFDDEGIGIRIEDTLVVTEDGCEVLSDSIPKEIADIEAVMKH